MAAIRFETASQIALHVLKQQGPKTTQQLYRACHEFDAKAEKVYRAPHHRDYRVRGSVVLPGTVPPPAPEHLVRSKHYLKDVMRNLEAYKQVAHCPSERWAERCKGVEASELYMQAVKLVEENKKAKESPFVWIDWEAWQSIEEKRAEQAAQRRLDKQRNSQRSHDTLSIA